MTCTITATEFKTFFDRGPWTYSANLPDVRDKDIEEAIAEALQIMNQDIYPDETSCTKALYYLTAHLLTLDLEMYDSGGQPGFNQTSRSVDGVSESVHIPEWMKEGDFAMYTTTSFGIKYLQLSKPYLGGVVYSVQGTTRF